MDSTTQNFPQTLKELRKSKKMTLVELAEKSGTSNSYLSQLENGRRNAPKPEMIMKISKGLSKNSEIEEQAIYETLTNAAGYDSSNKTSKEVNDETELFKILYDEAFKLFYKYEKEYKKIYSPREISSIERALIIYMEDNYSHFKGVTKKNIDSSINSSEEAHLKNLDAIINDTAEVGNFHFILKETIETRVMKILLEPVLNALARSSNQNFNILNYLNERRESDFKTFDIFLNIVTNANLDIDLVNMGEIQNDMFNSQNSLNEMLSKYDPENKTGTTFY